MIKKFALYVFNGDPMCVVHVWLNALEMKLKDFDVKIIIEGSATEMIKKYHENNKTPFYQLYKKAKDAGLIDAVCKACANKLGTLEAVKAEGLPLIGTMSGHPPMSKYIDDGYEIITF